METPTLLGYLAGFGSFSTQSEVLCTQGLTYILRTHKDARSALADEIAAWTGVVISDSLTWLAEAIQADGGRPDLEARADGVPVVKIEAKLGAELLADQLQSYVADLRERNSGEAALLVLVPKLRTAEAARVTAEAFDLSGAGPWRVTDGHRTGIAVISWDELFTALRGCKTERLRHELEQLQAMYRVLIGDYIAPLADEEDLRQWRERETDLVNVVDQVTRRLTTQVTTQDKVYPMQREPLEGVSADSAPSGHRYRYVCPIGKSCFSIGVRDSFAGWVTPVWMRFHRNTGNFKQIRQRVEASVPSSIESGGHIWIPLDVPFNVSGEEMIQSLVDQAEKIVEVIYNGD